MGHNWVLPERGLEQQGLEQGLELALPGQRGLERVLPGQRVLERVLALLGLEERQPALHP